MDLARGHQGEDEHQDVAEISPEGIADLKKLLEDRLQYRSHAAQEIACSTRDRLQYRSHAAQQIACSSACKC